MTRAPAPTRWAASASTPGRRAPFSAVHRPLGASSTSSPDFIPSRRMWSACARAVKVWDAMASCGGCVVCLPFWSYDLASAKSDPVGSVM